MGRARLAVPCCRRSIAWLAGSPSQYGVALLNRSVPSSQNSLLYCATPDATQDAYEAEKKRAEPYTKIVEELLEIRRDTEELVKKAVGEKRKAYALVNNRSEGNALLTIQVLRHAAAGCSDMSVDLSVLVRSMLSQVRTRVLNDELRKIFSGWYPGMALVRQPALKEAA